MKRLLLCLCCTILSLSVMAALTEMPELYFTNVTGLNSISQSNVKAIIQDSYGFMWFGTKNGLNRYDGYRFRVFNVDDYRKGVGNHNISALYEDADRKLWVGTDKGVYRFDPVTETFSFLDMTAQDSVSMCDWVSAIGGDSRGNVWVVIPNQGIFRYDVDAAALHHYSMPVEEGALRDESAPQSLCVRSNGDVWIGSNRKGLFKYDVRHDTFHSFVSDAYGNTIEGENIYAICEMGDNIIIGVHEGMLKRWNLKENRIEVFDTPQIHYKIIRCVKAYDRNNLLVATQDGLYIVDVRRGKVYHYYEDDMNPYGLSDNNVFTIYTDRDGGIWLGSLFGGVDYLPRRDYIFRKYFPTSTPRSIAGKRVREMCEDNRGNIWIGTEDKGVSVFNPHTHSFRNLGTAQPARINLALMADGDKVLVGIFKAGMEVYSTDTYRSRFYSAERLNLLDEASVSAIIKDSRGTYWLGNSWGIYRAPDDNFNFTRVDELGDAYVYDIAEDKDNHIWIASMGSGVMRYDLRDGSIHTYVNNPDDSASLSSNSVSSITVCRNGDVWFSTDRGGICRYNRATDDFTTFSIPDGFPDDVCYKILEDWHQNLWFGTNNGLVCFNPETRSVRVFTEREGLLSNQFNYKSALESRNGIFYFGTIKGLIAFNPHKIGKNKHVPPVYITRLQVHNKTIAVNGPDSLLHCAMPFTHSIVLNHEQENITLDFVALNYVSPSSNKFRYRLEGVDKDWVPASRQTASYSQLHPGKYMFHVQASNNDGSWNNTGATLQIIVTPPWWQSVYAYIGYLATVLLVIWLSFRWYKQRKERQQQRAMNLLQIRKEKELYSAKVEFFTSIAHEIKTPLSLIKGPLETITEGVSPDEEHKLLKVMEMNTDRLLSLINQLLDFRKIDSNRLTLNYTMQDVAQLLRETVLRFEPSFSQAGKSLQVDSSVDTLVVPIDKEEVTKVLSNLLNNALKYAAHDVRVELTCEEDDFAISVASDGEIIPPDKRKRIFEPFYQISGNASGVGLGLSLARSIVELHNGYLELHASGDGKYNVFTLTLPRHQEGVIVWDTPGTSVPIAGEEMLSREPLATDMSGCTVLVVDDNPELLSFLVDRLADKFTVLTASNGREALELISSRTVHIVVSDVMMPVMDGFELCRAIKNSPEYNLIPVILLSAKNDLPSKLHAMELGADAFIEKPFSFSYLIAKVNNILLNRQVEMESLLNRPLVHKMHSGMTKAEEELMQRITEVILQNIADENFNVERLAATLCMSRSALHRKIKELSDLPPVEYIRLVRLREAAKLLSEGKYTVAEVSSMVGIASPSYFSRLFQKQFGVTPKVFVMQQSDKAGQSSGR